MGRDARPAHKATLLTDADLAIQELIVSRIREIDPHAVVVAEEDDRSTLRQGLRNEPAHVWVIDPIDGTAEFVRPDGVEFCSAVCLLRRMEPVAAFVVAPDDHGSRWMRTSSVSRSRNSTQPSWPSGGGGVVFDDRGVTPGRQGTGQRVSRASTARSTAGGAGQPITGRLTSMVVPRRNSSTIRGST